jgi:phosphoribosylaminoimidazole carboxylase (NCAIR synthetase)
MTDARVHFHLYDKRRVFERRKMGHVTALGSDVDDALERAREAASHLRWVEAEAVDGGKEGER